MRPVRPVALRWAVVLAALLGAAPAAAQEQRLARIAYASNGDLHTIAADGSDRRLIAEDSTEPAWSPDATRLAFTHYADEQDGTRVWVSAADGSGARMLTRPPFDRQDGWPAWAPDGGRIAFIRITPGEHALVTTLLSVSSEGGEPRKIARLASSRYLGLADPQWSPDGRRILVTVVPEFDEGDDRGASLQVIDVATGRRTLLLRNARYGRWSPNGERLAYVSVPTRCEEFPCQDLYVANADGSGRRRLTSRAENAGEYTPAWSADGQRIVFASDRNYPYGGSLELYSIRPDGSCLTWLTNGTATSFGPAFEPTPGLSTDPGGCGAIAREPLIETDTSEVARYDEVPVWWLGPRYGNLLLSRAEQESGDADFSYDDCASFDPAECPPPITLNNGPVCSEPGLAAMEGSHLTRTGRALLRADRGDEESIYSAAVLTGPTAVYLGLGYQQQPDPIAAALRRFGENEPPAEGLPRAELPRRMWQTLERTRAAARKYGTRAAARRLRIPARRVTRRLALLRKLGELGPVGRLSC